MGQYFTYASLDVDGSYGDKKKLLNLLMYMNDVVRFSDRENGVVTRLPDGDYSELVFLCEDGMYDECPVDYFRSRIANGKYKVVDHINIESLLSHIKRGK